MSPPASKLFCARFAVQIVGVLVFLIWISRQWGDYYVSALLPFYRDVANAVPSGYRVLQLDLQQQNGVGLIAVHVVSMQAQTIGTRMLPAGINIDASTLADHALKHVIILLAAILVWPGMTPAARFARLLWSLPFLLLLEAIDIPLVLLGAIHDLVYFNLSADYATHKPPLVMWMRLLDGGGRLALSLTMALAINVMPLPRVPLRFVPRETTHKRISRNAPV